AMLPVFDDARDGKIVFGILASLAGLVLVVRGGYHTFQIAMRVCIGAMFATTVLTAAFVWPGTLEVLQGLFVPRIPDSSRESLVWTVALIGGIGGTLTVLCYGYWLREEDRASVQDLRSCRLD